MLPPAGGTLRVTRRVQRNCWRRGGAGIAGLAGGSPLGRGAAAGRRPVCYLSKGKTGIEPVTY